MTNNTRAHTVWAVIISAFIAAASITLGIKAMLGHATMFDQVWLALVAATFSGSMLQISIKKLRGAEQ